jgi:hypothetical protein
MKLDHRVGQNLEPVIGRYPSPPEITIEAEFDNSKLMEMVDEKKGIKQPV